MSTTSASDDPDAPDDAAADATDPVRSVGSVTTSEEAPPVTTRGDRAPRGWILPVVAVVLVLGVLATFSALRSTNEDIDTDRQALGERSSRLDTDRASLATANTDLANERHQLSLLVDGLQRTQGQLDTKTNDRDALTAAAEQTRVELFNVRASLNSAAARLYVQNKLLGDLQSCLRSADQALNALSIGNLDLGAAILENAKGACQTVNDYLAQAGLTT